MPTPQQMEIKPSDLPRWKPHIHVEPEDERTALLSLLEREVRRYDNCRRILHATQTEAALLDIRSTWQGVQEVLARLCEQPEGLKK